MTSPSLATPDRASAAFEEHWARVVRVAGRLEPDPAEAEDLAQEAFVRLHRAALDGNWPDVPGAWLTTVVTNLAISRRRHAAVVRRTSDAAAELHLVSSRADDPGRSAADHEAVDAIARAVAALGPDPRTATLLAAAGFSSQEIAERLGRSPCAVRTLLCRARHSLRATLALDLASG